MTKDDLNTLLNRVAVGEATTKEAVAHIQADLRAARRPYWVVALGLVLLLGPLGYTVKGCADRSTMREKTRAVATAQGCPECWCDCKSEWNKARFYYAHEMLRGLRITTTCSQGDSNGLRDESR